MPKAHVSLIIEQRRKAMHKKQAQRLLLAAAPGDQPSVIDPDKTRTEALQDLKNAVDFKDSNKLSIQETRDVRDAVNITEPDESRPERPTVGHVDEEYK